MMATNDDGGESGWLWMIVINDTIIQSNKIMAPNEVDQRWYNDKDFEHDATNDDGEWC